VPTPVQVQRSGQHGHAHDVVLVTVVAFFAAIARRHHRLRRRLTTTTALLAGRRGGGLGVGIRSGGGGGWLQSSSSGGSSSSSSVGAGLALFLGGCSFVVAAATAAHGIRVGRDGLALAGVFLGLLVVRAVAGCGGARRRRRRRRRRGSRSILGRAGKNVPKGGLVGFCRALVVVETDHPTGIQVGGFHHFGDEASLVDLIGRFLKDSVANDRRVRRARRQAV